MVFPGVNIRVRQHCYYIGKGESHMLIIGNGRLVTRDAGQPFFENGAVAIDGTTIKKVGTLEEIKKEFPEAEFVDAKGGVIMPAFIIRLRYLKIREDHIL